MPTKVSRQAMRQSLLYFQLQSANGRDYLYPACSSSKLLAKFAACKYFDANQLAALSRLGFCFEIKK